MEMIFKIFRDISGAKAFAMILDPEDEVQADLKGSGMDCERPFWSYRICGKKDVACLNVVIEHEGNFCPE